MITNFKIFDSYLEGGRQPLYHYTTPYWLGEIVESNELKISKAADQEMSISFSRSLYFSDAGNVRLVLDSDKLKKDGYKIIPYDEVGTVLNNLDTIKAKEKLKGYNKVNPEIPFKKIIGNNNFDYNNLALEWEYEERCFKDIKNLGKYLLSIDIRENDYLSHKDEIEQYLEQYPEIKIHKFNRKTPWDRRLKIKRKEKISINK